MFEDLDENFTICLIDDDLLQTFIYKKFLSTLGFKGNLITFKDGKQAYDGLLENLKQDMLPDIIFLDINMPLWDGWMFLDEISKIDKLNQKKVIMVSSSIDPEDTEKAIEYDNVVDYLLKPLKKESFEKIAAHIYEANLKYRVQ